jgi:hypothetical protein
MPASAGIFKRTIAGNMDSTFVKKLVEDELARDETFINFHGITPENVRSFLVEPFSVRTHPDELETTPRDMWIVLQECPSATEGYVIVYDPHTGDWGRGAPNGRGVLAFQLIAVTSRGHRQHVRLLPKNRNFTH